MFAIPVLNKMSSKAIEFNTIIGFLFLLSLDLNSGSLKELKLSKEKLQVMNDMTKQTINTQCYRLQKKNVIK